MNYKSIKYTLIYNSICNYFSNKLFLKNSINILYILRNLKYIRHKKKRLIYNYGTLFFNLKPYIFKIYYKYISSFLKHYISKPYYSKKHVIHLNFLTKKVLNAQINNTYFRKLEFFLKKI